MTSDAIIIVFSFDATMQRDTLEPFPFQFNRTTDPRVYAYTEKSNKIQNLGLMVNFLILSQEELNINNKLNPIGDPQTNDISPLVIPAGDDGSCSYSALPAGLLSFKNKKKIFSESKNVSMKRKKRLSKTESYALNDWLYQNIENPVMDDETRKHFMDRGISGKQLTNWMHYAKKKKLDAIMNARAIGGDSNTPSE